MIDGNSLLAALPGDLQTRVQPHLERVHLDLREPISSRGAAFPWVYFPTSCLLSEVVNYSDGNTIEAQLVGNNGHTGTSLILGST